MKLRMNRGGIALLASLSGAAGGAAIAVGCGGDDTSTSPAEDASVEAQADAPSAPLDGPIVDGSNGDVGSTPDAASEASPDSGDAGSVIEAGAPPFYDGSAAAFPAAVSAAFCTAKQVCCLVSPSRWNEAACVGSVQAGGGYRNLSTYSTSLGGSIDGGHVALDASAAGTCLADMLGLLTASCGVATSATALRLQGECYGAFQGTLGVDAGPCGTSLECAPGSSCVKGVCATLSGVGGSCTSTDDCSYRGSSAPTVYCRLSLDGGAGRCAPAEGLDGGDCANASNANDVCLSGLCGFNPGCADSVTFTDPGPQTLFCNNILPEAGPVDGGPEGG